MAVNRTYGFAEDFQKAIASASLQDPSLLKHYDDVIIPSYFDDGEVGSIIRVARELAERLDEHPTKMTVVEEVKEYCSRFNIPSSERESTLSKVEELYAQDGYDLEYVRSRVLQFGQRQALRSAVLKIVTVLKKPQISDAEYEKCHDVMEKALRVGVDARDLGLTLYPNLLKLPQLAKHSVSGLTKKVPTGIPAVDGATMGGPGRGEVWVVVGLPGRGKSAFLVNMGVAALKAGIPVFHYTIGDLDKIDVGIRYAARLTMCSTYEVITESETYMRRAEKLSLHDPYLRIKDWPSDEATMGHIRAHISKIRSIDEVSPGLVIIDYPEELIMPVKGDLYLSGSKNYSAANGIAREFDTLVWLASQPQRWTAQHPNDVITGQSMGESWKKFQKVDGMASWNMTYEEEQEGRARLWIDKTRRARSYYLVHMEVAMDKMWFRETEAPRKDND